MNRMPAAVVSTNGTPIRLGKQLGKGGEGIVLEAEGRNDIAIKLYHPNKIGDRHEKLRAMIAARLADTSRLVAYPLDIVFSPSGQFAGFAMRKIGGHKPIHELLSPASRKNEFAKANFRFLVRSAVNVARAVASVHATGCVIGDINTSGVLVSDAATVSLIDSDSFQVADNLKTFLCKVGVPEFTPPELQGKKFEHIRRLPNHDAFGLAVMIFQILFMGRHPFSGRYQGKEFMPLERSIAELRFAYSSRVAETKTDPPPHVPTLADVPAPIAAAFEKAFGRGGVLQRPSAAEWVNVLEQAERELTSCNANSAHHHFRNSPSCPWCKMEQAMPAFVAFAPFVAPIITSTTVDLKSLMAAIERVPDPGPAPSLSFILANIGNFPASPKAVAAKFARYKRYGLSAAFAVGGVIFFQFGGAGGLVALGMIGGSLYNAFATPREIDELVGARKLAEQRWTSAQENWIRQGGNQEYLTRKNEALKFIKELQDLPDAERRGLQRLETQKRINQLTRHLDKYYIARSRIRGVGNGRRATLASFGIETAADIEERKILAIPGFGPSLAADLLSWRRSQEAKFVFTPNEPLNPADIQMVRQAIQKKKLETENNCRDAITKLQKASALAIAQRRNVLAATEASYQGYKQACADMEAASQNLKLPEGKTLGWAIAALGLIALVVASNYSSKNQSAPRPPSVSTKPVEKTPPVQRKEVAPSWPSTVPLPRNLQDRPKANPFPEIKPDPPKPEPQPEARPEARELGKSVTEARPEVSPAPPPLDPPVFIPELPPVRPPLLGSTTATFAGGWATSKSQCDESTGDPPLKITPRRAEVSEGYCDFKSVLSIEPGVWRIAAQCSANGRSWASQIQFRLTGDTLIWSSSKGRESYVRCGRQ